MGIKRCPYCRALISDRDQYCKNCGTQLLFPEDEEIEEEIPGDKIIEDDRQKEDAEYLTGERLEEDLDKEEKDVEEESREAVSEEETDEQAGEVILKEDTTPLEEVEVGKISAASRKRTGPKGPSITAEENLLFAGERESEAREKEKLTYPRTEDYLVEKIKKEVLSESKPESAGPAQAGPGVVTRIVEELRRKEEQEEAAETLSEAQPGLVTRIVEELELEEKKAAAESYEVETGEEETLSPTFASAELDRIGATAELGRREVEDFFKVLEEKEKEHLKERLKTSGKGTEGTGEIPSWIKEVKTASTELLGGPEGAEEVKVAEKVEAETDELWPEEEEKATEPTMGFPERLTRSSLESFEAGEGTGGEVEMEIEEAIEETEEGLEGETGEIFQETGQAAGADGTISPGRAGESRSLPPLGFKNFVKAKIFDLLFLVMFWLVSIWIAARSMQTTIFKLFGLAGSGLLLYLLILTFFYFFLFYFFIGETLGDRLFRESEEEENSL
ncbi:MAG: zinc ribbon domain-containing protein [Candidatus Saccharicenans sp.]|nr:zinc ribbon domain-containing protein [Candidatus Saccharicenans sp.]